MTEAQGKAISASALIGTTWSLMWRHAGQLVLPSALLGALFFGVIHEWGDDLERSLDRLDDDHGWPFGFFEGLVELAQAFSFLLFLVAALFALATARAAFMPYRGEGAPRFVPARRAVAPVYWRGFFPLLVLTFVTTVAMFPVVPGVFLLAVFAVLPAVVVAEGVGGVSAVSRSWDLSRPHIPILLLSVSPPIGAFIVAATLNDEIPYLGELLFGAVFGAALAYVFVLATAFYAAAQGIPTPAALSAAASVTTAPAPRPEPVTTHAPHAPPVEAATEHHDGATSRTRT